MSNCVKTSIYQTNHEDIFSSEITTQKNATTTYEILLLLRENLLDNPLAPPALLTPGAQGPLHISDPSDISDHLDISDSSDIVQ